MVYYGVLSYMVCIVEFMVYPTWYEVFILCSSYRAPLKGFWGLM